MIWNRRDAVLGLELDEVLQGDHGVMHEYGAAMSGADPMGVVPEIRTVPTRVCDNGRPTVAHPFVVERVEDDLSRRTGAQFRCEGEVDIADRCVLVMQAGSWYRGHHWDFDRHDAVFDFRVYARVSRGSVEYALADEQTCGEVPIGWR